MTRERVTEMLRARFLFTLEVELQVHAWLDVRRAQRIERGQSRDDRTLVITRGTREQAPLALNSSRLRWQRNDFPTELRAKRRRPRRCGPLRRIHGLTVVVRVKHDGASRQRS